MPKLPAVSGGEAVKAFSKVGFELDRIRGSHHILKRSGHPNLLTVPVHGTKAIASGTLRALIRAAQMNVDEFCELL